MNLNLWIACAPTIFELDSRWSLSRRRRDGNDIVSDPSPLMGEVRWGWFLRHSPHLMRNLVLVLFWIPAHAGMTKCGL